MGADLSLETHSNYDSLSSGIHYYIWNTIKKKNKEKQLPMIISFFPYECVQFSLAGDELAECPDIGDWKSRMLPSACGATASLQKTVGCMIYSTRGLN